MKTVLLIVLLFVACKRETSPYGMPKPAPPPLAAGQCAALQYSTATESVFLCAHEGYRWKCTRYDDGEATCVREERLPLESS